jgi:hypothetical protein
VRGETSKCSWLVWRVRNWFACTPSPRSRTRWAPGAARENQQNRRREDAEARRRTRASHGPRRTVGHAMSSRRDSSERNALLMSSAAFGSDPPSCCRRSRLLVSSVRSLALACLTAASSLRPARPALVSPHGGEIPRPTAACKRESGCGPVSSTVRCARHSPATVHTRTQPCGGGAGPLTLASPRWWWW